MKKNHNMKKILATVALALVCALAGSAVTMTADPRAVAETTTVVVTSPFTEAIAKVKNSVVGVNNYQIVRTNNNSNSYGYNPFSDFFGFGFGGDGYGYGYGYGNGYGNSITTEEVLAATGSGVVVADGFVLTNYHVVEDASSLKISIQGEGKEPDLYECALVNYDSATDIAILKVKDLKLAPVALGDSDQLQVGDWAICIGNPLSETFNGTVTAGIISGLNREISTTDVDKYGRRETITNTMIQTDAAINNGNSGGGMFNVLGELVGIPTLKYSGKTSSNSADIDGIGMCIPINAAKELIANAVNGDYNVEVKEEQKAGNDMTGKPRLGISITSINTNAAAVKNGQVPNGVYVSSVEAGAPADRAGMKDGDIIVDVDNTVVTSVTQLQDIISQHGEGDTLKIKVFRMEGTEDEINQGTADGSYVDLEVTLAIVDAVAQ